MTLFKASINAVILAFFVVVMIGSSTLADKILLIDGVLGMGLSFVLVFTIVGTAIVATQSFLYRH